MAAKKVTPIPPRDVLTARLERQRELVFRAQGICGLGAASAKRIAETVDTGDHRQLASDAWTALEAAREILDEVAGELEEAVLLQPQEARPT